MSSTINVCSVSFHLRGAAGNYSKQKLLEDDRSNVTSVISF